MLDWYVYSSDKNKNARYTDLLLQNDPVQVDMKSLLIKDNKLSLSHVLLKILIFNTELFRSLVNSNMTLKGQIHDLQKTESKRTIIYDNLNIAINIKPYTIDK